jgi:hypothetical protein
VSDDERWRFEPLPGAPSHPNTHLVILLRDEVPEYPSFKMLYWSGDRCWKDCDSGLPLGEHDANQLIAWIEITPPAAYAKVSQCSRARCVPSKP